MRMLGVVVVSLAARQALACGGLFCSGTAPVDQSAEQVLFEVEDDGTITATVEVKYSGDPRSFSWIIPVHGTPDFVSTAPSQLFKFLEVTTRPSVIAPPTTCGDYGFYSPDEGGEGEGEGQSAGGGVDVTSYPDVGPYDGIVVVDGRDPAVLSAWLTDHGYLVTDAMKPVIEEYALENQKFLALRLQPDVDISKIVPVRFHCPAPLPVVPSRLTSLAAEPHMGMVVTLLASQRYTPANWEEVRIDPDDVVWDWSTYQSNYGSLVALRMDEHGGRAFAVERAGPSAFIKDLTDSQIAFATDYYDGTYLGDPADLDAAAYIDDVVTRHPYVTRFYTRVSSEEMTDDPQFRPAPELGGVDGTIDLSARTPVDMCTTYRPPVTPCSFLYCGAASECGLSRDNSAGCACGVGMVARAITSTQPFAPKEVACAPLSTNVMTSTTAGCDGVSCGGHGTCSAINGTAACACDAGTIAVATEWELGGVTCMNASELRGNGDIDRHTIPVQLDFAARNIGGAPFACGAAGGSSLLAALALVLGARRRRR